jgi:hypothetical protein
VEDGGVPTRTGNGRWWRVAGGGLAAVLGVWSSGLHGSVGLCGGGSADAGVGGERECGRVLACVLCVCVCSSPTGYGRPRCSDC